MAELNPPVALQNVDTLNADDFRTLIKALVPTEGVAAAGDLAVTANGTPNMSVNVAAGGAFIHGDDSPASQGTYFVSNDAVVNLAVTASDPTNPRVDIVIAEVRDTQYGVGGDDWRLRVVAGTPAATPSPEPTPVNSLKLATISVPAADTAISSGQITDYRTVAVLLGGNASSAWTAWVPTLTASSTNPTMGSSPIFLGRYERVGRTIRGWAYIRMGSSASEGDGVYRVSLPVAPLYSVASPQYQPIGGGTIRNFSSVSVDSVQAVIENGSGYAIMLPDGGDYVDHNSPFTWDDTDSILLNFEYEAVS